MGLGMSWTAGREKNGEKEGDSTQEGRKGVFHFRLSTME